MLTTPVAGIPMPAMRGSGGSDIQRLVEAMGAVGLSFASADGDGLSDIATGPGGAFTGVVEIRSTERHARGGRHREVTRRIDGSIERLHTPYFLPKPGDVIPEHVYRHGAVIVETATGCALFAPLPRTGDTYIDIERDAAGLTLTHGIGPVATRGHVFFRRASSSRARDLDSPLWARLAVWPGVRLEGAFVRAAALLWQPDPTPLPLPFDTYARAAIDRLFAPDLYREREQDGRVVAATITQSLTGRRPPGVMDDAEFARFLKNQKRLLAIMAAVQRSLFTTAAGYRLLGAFLRRAPLRMMPIASRGVWFNQVRTALGAALCARELRDAPAFERARRMINLALADPLAEGGASAVTVWLDRGLDWLRGTRAFEILPGAFHLPDMAVTGFHLLEWFEHVEGDPRVIAWCRTVADFLVSRQDADGAFPSWVNMTDAGPRDEPFLRQTAASAAPAMFLARLARFDDDSRWRGSAGRALSFIERRVLPLDDWNDAELALSCDGRPDGADPRTGVRAANTMPIYWAARAASDLAEHDARAASLADILTARLCLFQQPANVEGLSCRTHGGFACMNTDAELSDARQGLFVPLLLDRADATGDAALRDRAEAALRSCFSLMLIEDNRAVAPGNLRRFVPTDRGAIVENYGHTGRDESTAGYWSPDWGMGTALYALGMMWARQRRTTANDRGNA